MLSFWGNHFFEYCLALDSNLSINKYCFSELHTSEAFARYTSKLFAKTVVAEENLMQF